MKVTREKTENSQAFLTIEVEPTEIETSLEGAYRRLVKRASVPGFRKGKAPREILERYLGRQSLLEEALNHLLPEAYAKALKDQEIKAIAEPRLEVTQLDPVIFKATVPLVPVVKLGDYHQIQLKPAPVTTTEDDVNAAMEQLRHEHAIWEPVARAVDFGDLVVLDIKSQVDSQPFINQEGAQYQVIRDLPFPVPGFAKQLTGLKKEEEKEFKLQFPSDYAKKELAGKEASFKVKIAEIKAEKLPELNDDFAKQVNPELATLDLLRERVATNLKLRAEDRARNEFEEKVIESAVQLAQVEFPPVLVEAEIHELLEEQIRRLQARGGSLEAYLKSMNKTEAQWHEELRPIATRRVIQSLVLGKIAEEEKIAVSEPEIDAEIENMLKSATEKKEAWQKLLNSSRSRESIKQFLLTRKTINRLLEITQAVKTETTNKEEVKK